jgi:hypothetical protein
VHIDSLGRSSSLADSDHGVLVLGVHIDGGTFVSSELSLSRFSEASSMKDNICMEATFLRLEGAMWSA